MRELLKRGLFQGYRRLSAEEFLDIGQRYGLHYAVVASDAKLDLPVLARGTRYQIVALRPVAASE